jgi:hypothetical protein
MAVVVTLGSVGDAGNVEFEGPPTVADAVALAAPLAI